MAAEFQGGGEDGGIPVGKPVARFIPVDTVAGRTASL